MASPAGARIGDIVGRWIYAEPLLLAAWNLHSLHESGATDSIRTGQRRIEYNAAFIDSLSDPALAQLLKFEMVRVVLGHPYDRRRSDAAVAYIASNIVVQQCVGSDLPIPSPAELFDDPDMAGQYFERYYHELIGRRTDENDPPENEPAGNSKNEDEEEGEQENRDQNENAASSPTPDAGADDDSFSEDDLDALENHVDSQVGESNVDLWDDDELTKEQINVAIERIDQQNTWGSIGASGRETLRARLNPRLDYASVLRRFKRRMISSRRTLTRMKANRRYGLQQLGSRYTTEIRLLMAIDVSGSMSHSQIEQGLSVVNRLFRHGVCQTDLLQFDQMVRGPAKPLRRRRYEFEIGGGGGTNFQCVLDFVSQHKHYDGILFYTDGCGQVPQWPRDLRGRNRPELVWLLCDREHHDAAPSELKTLGPTTYLQ